MANQLLSRGPYDAEDESGNGHPDLGPGHNAPAGNSSDPRGHDVAAGDASDPRGEGLDNIRQGEESPKGLYNAGGDGATGSKGLAAAESATAASGGHASAAEQIGAGFSAADQLTPLGKLKTFLGQNRRSVLIGGGATGGIVAVIIAAFLALIPLKLENMVSNLQNRFFGTSESAVKDETNKMLVNYVKNHVIKDYKKCGTTVSKKCSVKIASAGSNPVTNVYKSWAQAKLENKLATNYGIEFKYDTASNTWYLKSPGTDAKGDSIGSDGQGLDGEFKRADRAEMRSAVSRGMEGETFFKQMMYRYSAGRLLEEKYGIKRCIIFCGTKDTFAGKASDKKIAAQVFLTQRVITPRTQTLGIVMECLLDTSCDPYSTQPTTPQDGSTGELNGEPENPATDTKVRTNLETLASSYGVTDAASVDKMVQDYKDIEDKGYTHYIITTVFEKIGLKELGSNLADTAPLIGWVNTAAKIIGGIASAGPKIKKLAYITNASAAVSTYMMYRTYADEVHTGHVDPTEVGSMVKSLGPGNNGGPKDPEVGGTATAESTPLYQNLMGSGSTRTTATLLSSPLFGSASAAASTATPDTSNDYKCHDNKPVKDLLCPEEKLGGGNALFNSISGFLNTPPMSGIVAIANAWNGIIGSLLGFIGNLFGSILNAIPGVSGLIKDASSFVSSIVKPFMDWAVNQLIPNPFGSNMSGGRTFDMLAAGSDVAGNDYAHTGLGGQAVSATTAAQVAANEENEARQDFTHETFFARMFSTDSKYSLVSQVAMDIPFDTQGAAQNSFAALLSNPFGAMTHGMSSIFSGRAGAAGPTAVVNGKDAFGVTQYMPQSVDDPEAYWDAHCADKPEQAYQNDKEYNDPKTSWNKLAASNPDDNTGMPKNTTANSCLLIKRSAGAAGGLFDQANLTSDDLADLKGTAGSTTTSAAGTGTYQSPFHSEANLVRSRVDEGVDYASTALVPVYAIGNGQVTLATSSSSFYRSPSSGQASWVTYKLTDGPAAGKFIYTAESCEPVKVKTGDQVSSNTQICSVNPSSIEMGWAPDGTSQYAAAHGVYKEGHATAYGQNFAELMDSLNVKAKPCYDYPGEALQGSLPSGWPTWVASPSTKAGTLACH